MHNYVSYSYTWFLGRLKTYHLLFYFIFIMDFQKCIRQGPWPLLDPFCFAATIFLKKNKTSTPSSESRIKGAGYKIQSLKSLQRKTNCTWCLLLTRELKQHTNHALGPSSGSTIPPSVVRAPGPQRSVSSDFRCVCWCDVLVLALSKKDVMLLRACPICLPLFMP